MIVETLISLSVIATAGFGLAYCVEVLTLRDCAGCGCETHGTYCADCLNEIGVGD